MRFQFIAVTILASAGSALACSDLPNICEQHEEVFRQNTEMAREAEEAYAASVQEQYDSEDESYDAPAPPPAYDPMQQRINMAIDNMLQSRKRIEDKAKLMKDPKYQAYANGSWSYFQDAKKAKPGEYCAAFFSRQQGFIMLSGPGGGYDGAMFTLWGMDIPRPKATRQIKVTLKQTNDKPQTVTAYNYYNPAHGMAAIAMAVPSIEAALAGVEDKATFELVTGGKSVARVTWHSGNKMKQKLAACLAKRHAAN